MEEILRKVKSNVEILSIEKQANREEGWTVDSQRSRARWHDLKPSETHDLKLSLKAATESCSCTQLLLTISSTSSEIAAETTAVFVSAKLTLVETSGCCTAVQSLSLQNALKTCS